MKEDYEKYFDLFWNQLKFSNVEEYNALASPRGEYKGCLRSRRDPCGNPGCPLDSLESYRETFWYGTTVTAVQLGHFQDPLESDMNIFYFESGNSWESVVNQGFTFATFLLDIVVQS